MRKLILPFIFIFLFTGCYSTVIVDSFPRGAQIITLRDNKKVVGTTPFKFEIANSKIRKSGTDCITDDIGLKLKWVSGANVNTGPIKICVNKKQNLYYNRPQDAPNLEIDLNHSYHLENLAVQKRQAIAAEDAAYSQEKQLRQQEQEARQKNTMDTLNYFQRKWH